MGYVAIGQHESIGHIYSLFTIEMFRLKSTMASGPVDWTTHQ